MPESLKTCALEVDLVVNVGYFEPSVGVAGNQW
jgi:hypothetical protein